jgi:hypothetical protein
MYGGFSSRDENPPCNPVVLLMGIGEKVGELS